MIDWAKAAKDIRAERFWFCFYEPDSPMVETELDNGGNPRKITEGCGGSSDDECRWRKIWGDTNRAEELCCTHHKTDVGCGWYRLERTT